MSRKQRMKSVSGMYHVMLRGINKQNIFIDDDDYLTMIRVLAEAHLKKSSRGVTLSENECQILAYAVMPNHVHILIKEQESSVSAIMKKIEDRFVWLYNKKYERVGHLFQDRFRSEPVDSAEYYMKLLRYIHRNPVQALLCSSPEEYPYSSWREYWQNGISTMIPVCRTDIVLSDVTYDDLETWVSTDVNDGCMDMSTERFVITDSHAWEIIKELSECDTHEDFKQLSPKLQLRFISQAIEKGVSIRQASRLSILSYSKIQREMEKGSVENAGQGLCPSSGTTILFTHSDPQKTTGLSEQRKSSQDQLSKQMESEEPKDMICALLRATEGLNTSSISKATGLSLYSTRKILDLLVRQGKVKLSGTTNNRRWQYIRD